MRLLFDQNPSSRLVGLLSSSYPVSVHVREVGLDEADDTRVWRYAAEHGLTIVSKDSDFHLMSLLYGHPPKVVWLRVGNGPTRAVAELLEEHHDVLQRFRADPDAAFLALA